MGGYQYKYLFGPVASRRLGRSLGVDIIPAKRCSYNCIYCQLGAEARTTVERREYVGSKDLMSEFDRKLKNGLDADYITFSGSGEPTLNTSLGQMIKEIKKLTEIPVAVLTNGSLLYLGEVRQSLLEADLVCPSLDAGSFEVFREINRPARAVDFKEMVEGLVSFTRVFKNRLHLEIFLVDGVNTSEDELLRIKEIVARIKPTKIEINTVSRPPAEKSAGAVPMERLRNIRDLFGPGACIIGESSGLEDGGFGETGAREIEELLKRRPCTVDDLSKGLSVNPSEVIKYVSYLKGKGGIDSKRQGDKIYYYWRK